MSFGRAAFALSLLALLAASLPGKTAPPAPRAAERTAETAAAALAAAGWQAAGERVLTVEGRYRLHEFRSASCDGAVLLGAPPANGELDTLLAELAGPEGRLYFIQDGRPQAWPPSLAARLKARFGPLLRRLGLSGETGGILAVIETGGCRGAFGPASAPES